MFRRFTLPNFLTVLVVIAILSLLTSSSLGQALGTAGTLSGIVTDPNNAVVPDATVTIENSITGFKRTVNTASDGTFKLNGVPPNTYSLTITATGFSPVKQTLSVRTSVP